ncbi:hypothetical protein ACIRP0_01990 [Streptomyces sp. NPDC101733]|uniref:hypothetical protein n=1 Tax=unclassified Streptomyces TaxID=2593676 RepID=UPI00382030AF
MKSRTRTLAVAGSTAALLAAVAAVAPGPAAAPAARVAAVHGAASVLYAYVPKDDIRFTVEAESAPFSRPLNHPDARNGLPTDARGKVTVYHHADANGDTRTSEAEVDCLVTGGRTATLSAVITSGDAAEVGKRIGISVQDGQHGEPDRLGFSWGVGNVDVLPDGTPTEATVGTCMALAPFTTVVKGGFTVTPAPLAPLPH